MCYIFKNLDLDNPNQVVDHIDGNLLNNHIDNLRVFTKPQYKLNIANKKVYSLGECKNEFKPKRKCQAIINGQKMFLGYFDNEQDARNAYLEAKKMYHAIE
jgi:hypothetical protein